MERKFDLVLFDLDGTLIDNRTAVEENVNFALNKFGFESVPGPKIDAQIGRHLPDIFRAFLPKEKWDLAEELSSAYRARYVTASDKGLVIFSEARGALGTLSQMGIMLGVVTNKMEGAAELLKKIGLYENFKLIISPSKELRPKPYPDMILSALESEKVRPERAAYVGDTAIDVASAKNAGVCSIAVMTGAEIGIVNLKELIESKPDFTIPNLSGLEQIASK
ncbi:MAG: HAD-IA family hydrolase [Candidatus Micrarchaeota archaeon]|nr:HAD-IA family hydrolase [Candidatus Micrarchaeota archaeon]